jgi:threonine synthase
MAAAVDHRAVIFAPKSAPPAKIAQLLIFGATVLLVDGNYDQAVELAMKASEEFGWYCRNTGYNPFTAEGKKTASFEIWEQLINSGNVNNSGKPLAVFVSVGDGNIISGIHKGFKDLQALDWIERPPKIYGVQADGSAAIANAFASQVETITPVSANTFADSISVDMPSDGVRAVRAATQTGGAYITVSDDEILSAIADLGVAGIFAEPAGATSYAGLVKAVKEGKILPDDPVVVVITGNGLKDISAAMKAVDEAQVIEATLEDLKRVLKI